MSAKKRLIPFIALPLLTASLTTGACEFHGAGFGGGLWGGAGNNFSRAPSFGASPAASSRTPLLLTVPALITATAGEEVELKISYELPQPKDNQFVQLALEDNSAISAADTREVKFSESNGQHTFAFVPNSAGTYRLNVVGTVSDLNNSTVYKEHIYLRVVEAAAN